MLRAKYGLNAELKKPKPLINQRFWLFFSGERGIRTPGTSRFNGFQDRRNRPLCHLSGRKSRIILHAQALAESFSSEFTQNP